jgi:hypothetical protein
MNRAEAFAFVAGGTVQAGNGVYLERRADRELLEHCRAGDFSYILTSRQMGKSSLMIRTAERLAAEGVRPVIVDLTEFGAQTTAEQWYKGFLTSVHDQLSLKTSFSDWWNARADHTFGQRFTQYLREVALVERTERVVIFVDEIDTTLRLDFTDDFFTAIRFLYQNRAADPALERLSFVLIGVATPGDLIKDAARTPFNIGHGIELTDFTLEEAWAVTRHLPMPEATGREVIGWTHRWTGGHPYLTLRTLRSLAEAAPAEWTKEAVDQRVRALFLDERAETDSNLQFVRDMLTKTAFNREAVLSTYLRIRRGDQVPDKELDQVTSWLKLSGVVVRRSGLLKVRNTIYEQVFDERWAREHARLHVDWRRRLTRVAAVLLVMVVLVTIPLATYAWRQKTEAESRAREAQSERDEAQRQREIAEKSLADTNAALTISQAALEKLKPYDRAAAEQIASDVESAKEDARRSYDQLTAGLRSERDDLARKLEAANQRTGAPAAPKGTTTPRPDRPAAAAPAASTTAPGADLALPPDPRAADKEAIRRTFRAFETAYRTMNVDALRKVQVLSAAEAKDLQSKFAELMSYQVTIDTEYFQFPSDRKAIVVARMSTMTLKRGDKTLLGQGTSLPTFNLDKRGDTWIIASMVVPPPR